MNEIINKFLLASDKFLPEMHLRQPGFTYALVGHLQKIKKELKVFANRKYRFYL